MLRGRRRSQLDPFKSPTYDTAENPMHDPNEQYDFVLGASKIPKQDIDQRDGAKHHAEA